MSELGEELDRLDFDYEEELVEVTPNFDYSNLRFDGIHYNLIQDRPATIPFWIAKVLQEQGMVEFTSEKSESFHQIKGLNQKQRSSPRLIELDELSFRMFLKEIDNLQGFSKTSTNVFKIKSMDKNYRQLIEKRTAKLLEMVRTDQRINNVNLTSEEKWFFAKMNDIYTNWKDSVGQNIDPDYPVKVTAKKSLDLAYDIKDDDEENPTTSTLSLKKGEMKEAPLFVAETLRDQGLVTIAFSEIDKISIDRIQDEEKRNQSMLMKINPVLYHFLRLEIKKLGKDSRTHNLSLLSEYQGAFNFILRMRTRKILKYFSDHNVNISNMTIEEQDLFYRIKRIYDDWLRLMMGEENSPKPDLNDQFGNDSPSEVDNDDPWDDFPEIETDEESIDDYLSQVTQSRDSGGI